MKLSVIICTYNRAKYLYNALDSVEKCSYPTELFELIVVNNNSIDNTSCECNRFANAYPDINFRYYTEMQQGLSYARNRGIQEAKGEIIIFIDDDTTVHPSFLQAYNDLFDTYPELVAAGGVIQPIYENKRPKWMNNTLEQLLTASINLGTSISKFPRSLTPFGANCAFKQTVFQEIGLFNVRIGRKGNFPMAGEESELYEEMNRMSLQYLYTPKAIVYHHISEDRLTITHLRKLTFAMGVSEKIRMLHHSKCRYTKRLIVECKKWGVLALRCAYYLATFKPATVARLCTARWYYTKGVFANLSKLSEVL